MTATKENARPVAPTTGTGGESDYFSSIHSSSALPHRDSTTPKSGRQEENARYRTICNDIFQRAKERVSVLEAARRLGLGEPDRSGNILCPFHNDHHPSLHIDAVKNRWKCFVCGNGKSGDATLILSRGKMTK